MCWTCLHSIFVSMIDKEFLRAQSATNSNLRLAMSMRNTFNADTKTKVFLQTFHYCNPVKLCILSSEMKASFPERQKFVDGSFW